MQGVHFSYPTWFIALCLLAGLLYAVFLYFRESKFKEAHPYLHWLLGILRFLTVAGISTLLLSPFIKSQESQTQDPFIVFLEDQSESIYHKKKQEDLNLLKSSISDLNTGLAEKYDLVHLEFGDEVRKSESDSSTFKVTNLSKAFTYIEENYGDQNLGAIVMSTDGIFNEGSNPIYSSPTLKAPIYFIAQGDTTQQKDISIRNIFNNKIAYLGDQFNVQVDIIANNCNGENTMLRAYKFNTSGKREKIKEERIKIDRSDFFTTKEFILDANTTGLNKYQISLSKVDGELSTVNNTKNFYIEVLDARQKILIYANAPHPDISALKSSLSNNKNYEIETAYANKANVNFANFDLVIFHNLPSKSINLETVIDQLDKRKTPRMFVVGAQTNLNKFNSIQNNLKITQRSNQLDDVQANINANFNAFTVDSDLLEDLINFSPLISPFGEYEAGPGTKTFLYRRIKKINTETPLLSFSELNGIKTSVLTGEGLWKWRLYDFLEHGSHDVVDYIIDKTVQYTTVKEDKRKFRASSSKKVYKENEAVFLEAQLFNNNYEAINEPDVFVSIYDSKNKEYPYTFSKKDNYYFLNPGYFPEGNYTYKAKVNFGGQELKDQGNFSVQSIELELYDLTARHHILHSLADKYGGRVFYPNETSELKTMLLANENIKPLIYSTEKTQSILNLKWIFYLLIGFLCLEWFIRRFNGSY